MWQTIINEDVITNVYSGESVTLTYSGGHQWGVNRDIITQRPELLQRHLLHPPAGRHLGRSDGVVSNSLKGQENHQ